MRIGSVGYATEQGLGHLLKWFYDHGVIDRVLLVRHGKHQNFPEWYPENTPWVNPRSVASHPDAAAFAGQMDVVVFWETPFDWSFVECCRRGGARTVLVPMYEWTPRQWPVRPDCILAPSTLDYSYFRDEFGESKCICLSVPVDPSRWKLRQKALRYLHNSGHIGHREHKGTRQLLEAWKLVETPVHLTVTTQEPAALRGMVRETLGALTDDRRYVVRRTTAAGEEAVLEIDFSPGRPYDQLFEGYDVYVAPEKFNGLSLPLREAYAAGLLVMTTDRCPTNDWLPRDPLIPVARTERACISRNYLEFDESIVEPRDVAGVMDAWQGKDIRHFSENAREWAQQNSWERIAPVWRTVLELAGNW